MTDDHEGFEELDAAALAAEAGVDPAVLAAQRRQVPALRAWMLAEASYARGELPDELLTYLQDHVAEVLDTFVGDLADAVAALVPTTDPDELAAAARDLAVLDAVVERVTGVPVTPSPFEWRA